MLRPLVFAVLAGSALAGPAGAQDLELTLQGEVPFGAAELRAAVQTRPWAAQALAGRAVAIHGSGSQVALELDGRVHMLDLGAARGPDAARLVALVLADLALEPQTAPESGPPPEAPAADPASPAPRAEPRRATSRPSRPTTQPPPASRFTRAAFVPSAGKGLGELDPWTYAIGLAVSQGIGPWLIEATLEFWSAPEISRRGFASGWDAARARLQAGVRFGALELVAGPALAPLSVVGGEGHDTVLFAASVTARAALRISRDLEALCGLGLDVFPHRVELQAFGQSVIATPRVAPYAAIGIGWRSS